MLHAIDEYEEFFPELPVASQFVRVRCEARLSEGQLVPCWIYAYVRNLAGVRRIDDGLWRGPAH